MRKWNIPVVWQVSGLAQVEAETLEEAVELAYRNIDAVPMPKDGEYIEDSFVLDCDDDDWVRSFNEEE